MNLDLILKDVTDPLIRENFYRLQTTLNLVSLLGPDWQFYDVEINAPQAKFAVAHGLKYTPLDIILVSKFGNYNCYFLYSQFDRTNIYVSAKGPVRLRFFAGRIDNYGINKTKDLPFVAPTGG